MKTSITPVTNSQPEPDVIYQVNGENTFRRLDDAVNFTRSNILTDPFYDRLEAPAIHNAALEWIRAVPLH